MREVQKNITAIFIKENKEQVEEFSNSLKTAGYSFEEIICDKETAIKDLSSLAGKSILLFVSDNFLKNTGCMEDALPVLQEISVKNNFLPIIIDGVQKDSKTGETLCFPTNLKKIGDIIKYMNYWQEKYLELRKIKRSIPDDESDDFNSEMKAVRSISSSIGEFFSFFRNINQYSYEDFSNNGFELFFNFTKNSEGHNEFLLNNSKSDDDIEQGNKTKDTVEEIEKPRPSDETYSDSPTLAELIHSSTTELIEENQKIKQETLEKKKTKKEKPAPIFFEEEEIEDDLEFIDEIEMREDFEDFESLINEDTFFDDENEEEFDEEEFDEEVKNRIDEEFNNKLNEDIKNKLDNESGIDKNDDIDEDVNVEEEDLDKEFDKEGYYTQYKNFLKNAQTLIKEGRTEEAIKLLEHALEIDPGNATIRYFYAYFLARHAQNLQEAALQLGILLDHQPNNKNALFLIGELAEFHKDLYSARNYYEKVIQLDPNYPNIYFRLGKVFFRMYEDKREIAAKFFKKELKLNSKNAEAHYYYGLCLLEISENLKKIISHFKKAVKLDKEHADARLELANAYFKNKSYKKALKQYKKAVELDEEIRTEENDNFFLAPFKVSQKSKNEQQQKTKIDLSDFEKDLEILKTKIAKMESKIPENLSTPVIKEEKDTSEKTLEKEDAHINQEKLLKPTQDKKDKPALAEKLKKEKKSKSPVTKIAFITGATSGIGKATANIFAENGYDLVITGRRVDRLKILKSLFEEKHNINVEILPFDIRNKNSVKAAFENLDKKLQTPDILINNAGLAKGFGSIHEGNIDDWETMIDTNIKGMLYMTRVIAPKMVKNGGGHIINIGSIAGKEVYPNGNVYCATKYAVDALSKAMRIDLAKHNIRVSQINPGHVEETEFALVRFDGDKEKAKIYNDFQPLKAEDIAKIIYFLTALPPHVNISDIIVSGLQQASATIIERSGR